MSPTSSSVSIAQDGRNEQITNVRLAQIRLLYENANTGIIVTIIAAPILAYFLSSVIEHRITVAWLLYMLLITSARFLLSQRYWRNAIYYTNASKWSALFAIGAGLAGVGWGAAGILLYPNADVMRQTFLVFVLGGMMLGGAPLLAARPEAFLAFLIPTGILPTIRLYPRVTTNTWQWAYWQSYSPAQR